MARETAAIAARIATKLDQAGEKVYYVGGAVRDMLLGFTPFDHDLTTSATLKEIELELTPEFKTTRIDKYLILRVSVDGGSEFVDISEFRKDVISYGRQQDVERASSIEEDLSRRDFTVNAIAMDAITGEMIDPHDGIGDIAELCIRTVTSPDVCFSEDYLRIVRAMRFAATYGMTIDHDVSFAMKAMSPMITKNVPPERIRLELEKII